MTSYSTRLLVKENLSIFSRTHEQIKLARKNCQGKIARQYGAQQRTCFGFRMRKVEACNLILWLHPLTQSHFEASRDQPQAGSFLHQREEPGNEVGVFTVNRSGEK